MRDAVAVQQSQSGETTSLLLGCVIACLANLVLVMIVPGFAEALQFAAG